MRTPFDKLPKPLQRVLAVLSTHALGRANAKYNGQLAELLEMDDIGSSGRAGREGSTTLSRRLQQLRKHGWPVASDKFGIYLAETPEDLQPTIDDFRSRAVVFDNAAEALEHARKFMRSAVQTAA